MIKPARARRWQPISSNQNQNHFFIFGDDVGWGDLEAHGGGETRRAHTELDRMAAEGVGLDDLVRPVELHGRPRIAHHRTHSDPPHAVGGDRSQGSRRGP